MEEKKKRWLYEENETPYFFDPAASIKKVKEELFITTLEKFKKEIKEEIENPKISQSEADAIIQEMQKKFYENVEQKYDSKMNLKEMQKNIFEKRKELYSLIDAGEYVFQEDDKIEEKYKILAEKFKEREDRQIGEKCDLLKAEHLFVYRIAKVYNQISKYANTTSNELPFALLDELATEHYILFSHDVDISKEDQNVIRTRRISTGFCEPTHFENINEEMIKALKEYGSLDEKDEDTLFERIAKLHAQIVRIQPFLNGNKRTAQVMTNGMLRMYGLPVIEIDKNKEDFGRYRTALVDCAIIGRDVTPLASFIMEKVLEAQNEAIKERKAEKEDIQK